MQDSRPTSVRLPEELANWIKDKANKSTRSFNGQLVALLKTAKEAEEQQTVKKT